MKNTNIIQFIQFHKPVIVLDVDGVLLHWGSNFYKYCKSVGVDASCIEESLKTNKLFSVAKELNLNQEEALNLINSYAEHPLGSSMSATYEAIRFINRHKDRYNFIAVSGFHNSKIAVENRKKNLIDIFGDVFLEVHCVGIDNIPRGGVPISHKASVFANLLGKYHIAAYIDDDVRNLKDAYYTLNLDAKNIFHLCTHLRTTEVDDIAGISYTVTPSLDLVNIEVEYVE